MVAAAGNAGPKSPPLYPAAYASVIAVSATDAQDRLFAASNRGGYIAVAAPGVDIFLPAPDEQIPDHVRHLVFRGLCQRPRGAGAGAQSRVEAGRVARDPDEDRPRSRRARPRRSVRRRRGGCLCGGLGRCAPRRSPLAGRPAGEAGESVSDRKFPRPGRLDEPATTMASEQAGRWRNRRPNSRRPSQKFLSEKSVPKVPGKKLKKFQRALNVRRPCRDSIDVGAVIPPHRGCIWRERPSTPSAHIA